VKPANLLILAPFEIMPPHFGASERAYNIVEQLNLDGRFSLTLLYTDYAQVQMPRQPPPQWENTTVVKVGPTRRWAQFINPALIWRALQIIRHEKPDLILCDHLWAGWHADILHLLTGIPFILDEHNVEHVRFARMGKWSAPLIRLWEYVTCRLAAAILAVSEADKSHLLQMGLAADKIAVVPNAIDMAQYQPNPAARAAVRAELGLGMSQPMLLFFGKLDYQPNAEAIAVIVEQLMPRILAQQPEAQFVICGYNPPVTRYQHPRLHFTGFVPKIEDYINASDVVLVPLLSGGGTKFKIIQTIACGKPVVATTIGAEGLERTGEWMHISDDWDEFVRYVLAALAPTAPLNEETRAQFRYYYSWEYMRVLTVQVIQTFLKNNALGE
jgi:glycosyltransferase involved in cell wall biosynthesis